MWPRSLRCARRRIIRPLISFVCLMFLAEKKEVRQDISRFISSRSEACRRIDDRHCLLSNLP